MAEKTKKEKTLKRNLAYVLWVAALVAIMVTAVILAINLYPSADSHVKVNVDNSDATDSTQKTIEEPSNSSGKNEPNDVNTGNNEQEPSNEDTTPPEKEPDQPTLAQITFIMPCSGGKVLKGYTDNTLVFNSTLGAYMGHMAIDFAVNEGTDVLCVYDGVIESITTSYLTGTTIVVDHGNNLKTAYNSVEANEALYEGAKVTQGAVIGKVTNNNMQEYKDGTHLHFEVWKNGEKINPEEYLIGDEK